MTVIAWDGRTIACDSQANDNGVKVHTVKLVRIKSAWTAVSGSIRMGIAMRHWLASDGAEFPEVGERDEGTRLIVFSPEVVNVYEGVKYPSEYTDKIMAWGCGSHIAIGAMGHGADAVEAVRIACKYEVDCGGDVLSAEIGDEKYRNWGSA